MMRGVAWVEIVLRFAPRAAAHRPGDRGEEGKGNCGPANWSDAQLSERGEEEGKATAARQRSSMSWPLPPPCFLAPPCSRCRWCRTHPHRALMSCPRGSSSRRPCRSATTQDGLQRQAGRAVSNTCLGVHDATRVQSRLPFCTNTRACTMAQLRPLSKT